jgi:hypothetical protein
MIKSGLSPEGKGDSVDSIFKILKESDFRIEDNVDSEEVSGFVGWVESTEQPDK